LVARLRALVAEHPERERLWCQLAQAEYRNGRRADALRTLERWRRQWVLSGQRLPPRAAVLERAIFDRDPTLDDREVGWP
jgi:DNA-binding SARP family transcriptional activator